MKNMVYSNEFRVLVLCRSATVLV